MWTEKKFVVEIDEIYVDLKNHQMVTYTIGKAYDKKKYIFNFFDETYTKKNCFLTKVKKNCKQQPYPPPPYIRQPNVYF